MPELPTTFGKYFLTEKLATGGMAEIYLAKIVGPGGFEKPLVIKQIHPRLSGQRHFVDLFVAEAKTLVALAHGNIVPVYELGVVEDTYFIAMDYIDGPTLYRLTEALARRDALMEPALAAWIAARILDGLDYAHRKGEGVIHRDLSPRNVMLSRDGEVKLVDFGIAVTLGDGGEDDSAQSAPTGSFPYMSPEQVRKEHLTGQTDLFSVGVLLWEMLVGRRLFARTDPDATLRAVLEGDIAVPSSLRPEMPARLDEVVMRALERDKTARWADAAEMLAALNKYLYSLDDTPGPREVAALVARYCPPETRRLPTHAEPIEGEPEATAGETQATPPPGGAGPATAVIPRDQQARGKPRAATRNESFATNVQLQGILDRGTPMFGVPALPETPTSRPPSDASAAEPPPDLEDPPGGPTTKVAPRVPTRAASQRGLDDGPDTTMRIRAASVRGHELDRPPGRTLLVLAGLGALALSIATVVVFLRGRGAVLAGRDAGPTVVDVPDAPLAPPADAMVAAPGDAAVIADAPPIVPDAAVIAPRDAAVPPPRDAGAPPPRDAATPPPPRDAAAKGSATLVVGADPWGEVVIDGVKRGRAPGRFSVPAGAHTVEIVFPGSDPPRTRTFQVDVAAGGSQDLFADFRGP